jgi:hypothetical protein
MNSQVKAQWIQALRSGEYSQTQAYLKKDDGFCCLGVLCDLHSRATGNKWNEYGYLGMNSLLPNEVINWVGLSCSNLYLTFDGQRLSLTHLNDHLKLNFNQIADLIEEGL